MRCFSPIEDLNCILFHTAARVGIRLRDFSAAVLTLVTQFPYYKTEWLTQGPVWVGGKRRRVGVQEYSPHGPKEKR